MSDVKIKILKTTRFYFITLFPVSGLILLKLANSLADNSYQVLSSSYTKLMTVSLASPVLPSRPDFLFAAARTSSLLGTIMAPRRRRSYTKNNHFPLSIMEICLQEGHIKEHQWTITNAINSSQDI
jgi:hypothetical protein